MQEPSSPTRLRTSSGLVGLAILAAFLWLGELFVKWTDLSMPGNVMGMLFLFLGLCSGLIRLGWVESAAALVLQHLGLYFVPAGVGLMLYGKLIRETWPTLIAIILISTLAVLSVTGWVTQIAMRKDRDEA